MVSPVAFAAVVESLNGKIVKALIVEVIDASSRRLMTVVVEKFVRSELFS